ncbi:Protein kinase domain-containing protein [Pleurotus pulmonarius]
MCQEMSGYWVGPCETDKFFELTMPLDLEEGAVEELPNIDPKFFAEKKPANEDEVYAELGTFFMKTPEKSHFEGLKMVDSSRHADPDSKAGSKVKPDGALHDADDASVTVATPTRLGSALSPLELKSWLLELFDDLARKLGGSFEVDTIDARAARGQLATYATEYCARQHRTHLLLVYIYFPCARLIRFDRCGALVSERINLSEDCTPLIRFYSRFSKMTEAQRGYDPTVKLASDEETKLAQERLKEWKPKHQRPVFKMDVYDYVEEEMEDNDKAEVCTNDINVGEETTRAADENVKKTLTPRKFLVWGSLADPDSPLGRATRGYPALEVTDGLEKAKDAPLVFLKEQWRSKAMGRGEIAILRELNKHGVEHVPTFVCGGDLPGQVTQTDVFANKIDRIGGKPIDQRTHVRFVVEEVGRPLECFSSSKEMFQAIHDAFQGHKQAFEKCEILHRDISGGNILILPKGGGLLNDWDMAVKVEEAKLGPRAHERTGTWAFMSIKLLSGKQCLHTVSDDMESFFWVVLYYSLLYLPHNKAKGGDGKTAVVSEGKYIGKESSDDPALEFTSCRPLTEFINAILCCMESWKALELSVSSAARAQATIFGSAAPPPLQIPERTHKEVIHIWEGTLALPWPTGDKAVLQFVKKSEGGTEGGGSKKRKSTTQLEPNGGAEGHKPKKSKTNAKILSAGTRKSSRLRRG